MNTNRRELSERVAALTGSARERVLELFQLDSVSDIVFRLSSANDNDLTVYEALIDHVTHEADS